MRLFIIGDSECNKGERVCSALIMKDKDREDDIVVLINEITYEYYKKVYNDSNFMAFNSLESYVKKQLEEKHSYQFIEIAGQFDLAY